MFSNQTMRQPKQGKPHIARVAGYWRVSPLHADNEPVYYEAHRWAARRNRAEHKTGVANCPSPYRNPSQHTQAKRNLDKQLRHALSYNAGPAAILGIIERNVL